MDDIVQHLNGVLFEGGLDQKTDRDLRSVRLLLEAEVGGVIQVDADMVLANGSWEIALLDGDKTVAISNFQRFEISTLFPESVKKKGRRQKCLQWGMYKPLITLKKQKRSCA